jgi:hypothetical protein
MSAESREKAQDFLALRNLLRLYESGTPIETRVREHAGPIRQYAAELASVISIDPSCQARLRDDSRAVTTSVPSEAEKSWSSRLLSDIRRSADWGELEARARILAKSADQATRREARAALAEALIHSDEAQKREEAFRIASELASDAEASDSEILLAAGAAEVCGDLVTARRIVMAAMKAGRRSLELVEHARNLSTRAGDRELRIVTEQASAKLREGSE